MARLPFLARPPPDGGHQEVTPQPWGLKTPRLTRWPGNRLLGPLRFLSDPRLAATKNSHPKDFGDQWEEGAGLRDLPCKTTRSPICSSSLYRLTNGCRRCQSFPAPASPRCRQVLGKAAPKSCSASCDRRSFLIGGRVAGTICGRNGDSPRPPRSLQVDSPAGAPRRAREAGAAPAQ